MFEKYVEDFSDNIGGKLESYNKLPGIEFDRYHGAKFDTYVEKNEHQFKFV